MDTVFALLVIVGVVLWIRSLSYKVTAAPTVPPPRTRAAATGAAAAFVQPPVEDPYRRGDEAFFDGYIWGRYEERHDHQSEHAQEREHDLDMALHDDCHDDWGDEV